METLVLILLWLTPDQDNFHALANKAISYSLLQLAFSQSQLDFLTYN